MKLRNIVSGTRQCPVLYGILYGQGLFVLFILFEYFLVSAGISECGFLVDSCIRIAFGIVALLIMRSIYGEEFKKQFTVKIKKKTLLYCIPFFLYLVIEFLNIPISEKLTTAYVFSFLLDCIQELATGFWEETASKGLVMSGMYSEWRKSFKGRIGMVFITGVLFGTMHIFNVLFTNDIISSLWNALYASAFGVFLAAIYLQSNSITMCMALHAVWDIVIRIPGYFCENVKDGWILTFINYSQDIIELGVFPIIAVLICMKYKRNEEVTKST